MKLDGSWLDWMDEDKQIKDLRVKLGGQVKDLRALAVLKSDIFKIPPHHSLRKVDLLGAKNNQNFVKCD
ncbi:hypothetical protein ACE6H2_022398 [Prunus campanulata]